MKINYLTTIIVGLLIVAMFSFVAAVKDSNDSEDETPMLISANLNATENETVKPVKNMTFGLCVAEAAKLKNDCYKSTFESSKSCRAEAKNQTDKKAGKAADKECKLASKTSTKQCKADFKSAKQECNKIKHSWFEGLKASFK